MAIPHVATTRHHHPESLSGILTTNTQIGRRNYQEGEAGRKNLARQRGAR